MLVHAPTRTPLSVVVPTHGRTPLFLETLQSLEQQTLASFEVVVTDDSPDETDQRLIAEAVATYRERTGRRARYVFTAPNLGQARNTNQGLAEAQGALVRILHSDDVLASCALEAEVALMNDPELNLDVLYHERIRFTNVPRFDQQPALTLIQPALLFRSMMNVSTPLPSATVFRRGVLDDIGGLREDFDFMCDWDLWIRLLTHEQQRHRFIGRLSAGYVGWRGHADSTTGRLWHRHFLEHEALMEAIRADQAMTHEMIGGTRTQDHFFAHAVRYRYRRLHADLAAMSTAELGRSLKLILQCVFSMPSLRARLTPAPWSRLGRRKYASLPNAAKATLVARWKRTIASIAAKAPKAAPKPVTSDPRRGWRFALSARLAATIIRWGKAAAARCGAARNDAEKPVVLAGPPALDPARMCARNEVDFRLATANADPTLVRVITDYNNTTNFWPLRRLVENADVLVLHHINANAFVEPVLHQCLKFTSIGTNIDVRLEDNQNLTSFGFKSLLERLFPGQFAWVEQSTRERIKTLRYERRELGSPAVWAPHTGWTFGILTTGARLENVERFIQSVQQHCREPYEILIVSPIPLPDLETYRRVSVLLFSEHDELGWITRKKNLIAEHARYSDILVCHDRFTIDKDFATTFADWGYSYGLAALRVRLEDGRRGLDWGVVSSQNHVYSSGGLLDYRAYSQYVYVPGGATAIRRSFWKEFPWNENLFWNEHEDVELCRRVQRAGGVITLSAATVIAAEDRWVHLNPVIPFCDQHEVLYGRPVGEQRIHFLPKAKAA